MLQCPTMPPEVPSSCPSCGAAITWAQDQFGTKVPLEKWTDPTGSDRYRIVELGPPLIVARVSRASAIDAYPSHYKDCPAHGNGLET